MSRPASLAKADIQAWGAEEARLAFGDDPKKQAMACEALDVGLECVSKMPIGWNISDGPEQFGERCHAYLTENYKPKPVGFLPAIGLTWFFWQIVGALISWAVHRLIEVYYPKTEIREN